ncbi:A24 family peptidase [Pseudidiomarina taiwanensis]|uniref:prepilin peptidase n=1 Tax=Pseudidiomarina taiwanensis TaxID=337250 RepID=UPI00268189BE
MFELYAAETPWALGFGLVLGLMVGSFLNVVIGRYPQMLQRQWRQECQLLLEQEPHTSDAKFNLATPNSHCPKCQSPIRWYDNIPVLSWTLWLRGKCRNCQAPISIRYPSIELLTGAVFAYLTYLFGVSFEVALYWVAASLTISLFFIDYDTQLLPDPFNYVLLWLGLAAAMLNFTIPLQDAVIGAMLGYLILWSIYWLFKLLTGKEGMGYGDFKLLAAIGAWVGYSQLGVVILASAGSGAVIGIIWQFLRGARGQAIPFGPFLILGGIISLIWGDWLVAQYWQWALAA